VSESTPVEVKFAHVFPYSRDHEISAEVQSSGSQLLGEVTIELRPLPDDHRADLNWSWRSDVHNKVALVVSLGSKTAQVVVTVKSHELGSVYVCFGNVASPATLKIARVASSPKDTCPVRIAVTRVFVR